jgi:TonB family protein
MTALLSWMPLESGLGWTLIHFLWQGFVLAALLKAVLPLCRSASARHNCALAILVLMALAPVATFLSLHDFAKGGTVLADNAALSFAPASPWINGLVVLWLAGIAGLSLRALGGWHLAESLARRDTLAAPAALLQRCRSLQRRLAVTWPVRFLLSYRVSAPVVIGCLRPVVLIPVSAVAGLSPDQLDALILHELAHIRRFDTVTNILLTAVETILFYHPVVWWVSRQVRIEREHCCDDFAVSACGDAAIYVEALTLLTPWNAPGGAMLAASGGKLKDRAARLLDGTKAEHRSFLLPAITGLALVGLLAGSVAMAQTQLPAHPAESTGGYLSNDNIPVMLQPIAETHALPPYPKESVHLKEQGRVKLAVTIGTDGAVSRASIMEPSGHQRLDAAALQFVKSHWRWQPATRKGKHVVATTRVSVVFNLKPPKPKQSL